MDSTEDKLIARFFKPLATHPGAFNLTDDCAVMFPPEGHEVVLKTDTIVGGVHFFPEDPPGAIARKALRVNLSDLAAKGANPAGFLLSLVIPREIGDDWLEAFAAGLREDSETFQCPLFGGDTDRTPGPVVVAIFALGILPRRSMVRRAGAQPGDVVFVTGTIGDAALGLKLRGEGALAASWSLSHVQRDHLLDRYLLPQPRVALADIIRAHAKASMDVSDGLAGDLAKLCRVSGVAAEVDVSRVPLSGAARQACAAQPDLIEPVLTGGDDYEILGAIPPEKFELFREDAEKAGVKVTEIGRFIAGTPKASFVGADGQPLSFARPSFSHF